MSGIITNLHSVKWDRYHLGTGFLPGDAAAPIKYGGNFGAATVFSNIFFLMAISGYLPHMVEWCMEVWFFFLIISEFQYLVLTQISVLPQMRCLGVLSYGAPAQALGCEVGCCCRCTVESPGRDPGPLQGGCALLTCGRSARSWVRSAGLPALSGAGWFAWFIIKYGLLLCS